MNDERNSSGSGLAARLVPAPPEPIHGRASQRGLTPLLLPRAVLRGWIFFAVCVVPQAVLLLINLRAWELASGEVSPSQQTAAGNIFTLELLSLLGSLALAGWLALRRQTFQRWQGGVPLVLSSLFLATVFILGAQAIPPALSDWIIPRDQWMLKQFALVMPAALFGALRLLCPDREAINADFPGRLDWTIGICIGLFACCLGFLILVRELEQLFRVLGAPGHMSQLFRVGGFILLSTLAAAGLLRLCISIYVWARENSPGQLAIFTALVALVGPLLGLSLNASIPFPANFQIPAIYALAALNGIVLVLPNFAHPLWHRLVWLAQCALFPFTVYFFAVFLPFLTLGPMAVLAMGLGFLIYIPSLLFLLHGCRLLDGFRAEVRDGRKWVPALLGISAILAWPLAYTIQARSDRATLHRALDYLHYPDYSAKAQFDGSLRPLHSALIHLRDFKYGIYLPYLSEYYNRLAFDNLVLPQAHLDALSLTFFGEPLPKSKAKASVNIFGWGRSRPRTVSEHLGGVEGTRPSADALLERVETTVHAEQGAVRAKALLTISNSTQQATEFQTTITVPPGVMISGLWLTIGTDRVPGRIFEKRSAMWVYQKITALRPVPRDPAILRYVGPNQAELKVYPVEPGQSRRVEVEFLFPEGLHPKIQLLSHGELSLPAPVSTVPSLVTTEDRHFAVTIPPSPEFPTTRRKPYFHFLIDASKNSKFSDQEELAKAISQVAHQFPEIRHAKLSFVNFETTDLLNGEIFSIEDALQKNLPALKSEPVFRGGFLDSRAIKEVLWQQHRALAQPNSPALGHFPQIIVLRGSNDPAIPDPKNNLAEFARWLPDLPGYWTLASGDSARVLFSPFDALNTRQDSQPVSIFEVAGTRFAAATDSTASYISLESTPNPVTGIMVFDPAQAQFVPVTETVARPASTAYARSFLPWSLEMKRCFEPFRHRSGGLGELLRLCRETGILVPSAAYMVVETSAQWKILERTEKKALKGHEAMAVSEPSVPEPGTVVLLCLGALVFAASFWRKSRSRRRQIAKA